MGKVIISVQVTADSVMDEPDGWFDGTGLQEVGSDELFLSEALLLGRKTYASLAPIWQRLTGDFADRMNSIPKFVASKSGKGPLDWNATMMKGDLAEEVRTLKRQYSGDLLVYGCGEFAFFLVTHGLADELRLWIHPIVWGGGVRLFHDRGQIKLGLKRATVFPVGVTLLTLEPLPEGPGLQGHADD